MPTTRLSLITGPLGSGKTTLLQRMIAAAPLRLAVLINEFGELGIDGRLIRGKHINMVELAGGCACCELSGEFEAAVKELIETFRPELIVVEATGVAESDALVLEVEENIPDVRLDSVVCMVDAYTALKYPQVGYVGRQQLQAADVVVLNKVDLATAADIRTVEDQIRRFNPQAPILPAEYGNIDPGWIWGAGLEKRTPPSGAEPHRHTFEQFVYRSDKRHNRARVEQFLQNMPDAVFRAKGFILLDSGVHLLNVVAGRFDIEPYDGEATRIVFIGPGINRVKEAVIHGLEACSD